jgi:uncharacterized membrane-anchored protein
MRKAIVLVAGLAILAIASHGVYQRERLLEHGRVVLLSLAPVDPRSLMQGDYMALRFADADSLTESERRLGDGHIVLKLDDRGVGRFVRRDEGQPLQANEVRMRYRIRGDTVKFATNAWFFEEGQAERFASARFGEFRVGADGEAILTALRNERLERL